MSANASTISGTDPDAGKLITTWRTVQKLDADAWRNLRDDAPLRVTRWLLALATVGASWDVLGIPEKATAWLPVLGIVVLLLLPDASAITFGGFTYQSRMAAAEAKEAAETVREVKLTIEVAREVGEAAVVSARARSGPGAPAAEALREFL